MRNIIGIRRESIDEDERRAPLSPSHVESLVRDHGISVCVQPSDQRIYTDEEYTAAGATVTDHPPLCNIVFGVKEIAVDEIRPNHVYCYFSHTIKAQRYNMPMLAHIIDVGATLLDYELVTNEMGQRLIFFGDFAGYAGIVDALAGLGLRLDAEGIANPFASLRCAGQYESLADARAAVAAVGRQIRAEGLPESLAPLICIFTGRGHVSRGAQRMFSELPVVKIVRDDIPTLASSGAYSNHAVYAAQFTKPDLYRRISDGGFDASNLDKNPGEYEGYLHEYLAYATVLVNGIYWSPRYPRLFTRDHAREMWAGKHRPLRVIADITCDIEGSVEVTVKSTTVECPFFVYEPASGRVIDGHEGDGPVVLAVDKLPTAFPREATDSFGDGLAPFVTSLARCDFSQPFELLDLPAPFKKSVIAHQGRLTENFQYLNEHLLRKER